MRVKNTHWTYCTQFSQSYKTTLAPPRTVRSTLSALYPLNIFFFLKRQQGTLLSCQLTINGSASHLHRHNFPRLTTHTLFRCSKGGRCWATRPFRHCVDDSLHLLCLKFGSTGKCNPKHPLCLSAYPSWLHLLRFPLSAANTSASSLFLCSFK